MNPYRKFLICSILTLLANSIFATNKISVENEIDNLLPREIKILLKDSLNEYLIPDLTMFDNEWKSYDNISIPMFICTDFNGN